jgi:hypothetical protein
MALRAACLVLLFTVGSTAHQASPPDIADHPGFRSIFDGKTLAGWDGDPACWRAENGVIVGQTTAEQRLADTTFLIWRGGQPADFELKLEFRLSAGNSGVQIRSTEVGNRVMKGYQADIDFANHYTGQIYEEKGRGLLALRGQAVHVPVEARPEVIGTLHRKSDDLEGLIKIDGWNQLHLVARDHTIVQILNGAVMSLVVDDDVKNRSRAGLIGLQLHAGSPMRVEFRNIGLKTDTLPR